MSERPSRVPELELQRRQKLHENTLREAIANGADSVAALSEATKAGTGCGSCKGELGQLVSTLVRKPAAELQVAN